MEVLRKAKHKKIKIMTTNSIFLIQYCYFVMKYGISLMDPKAFYFNKICLRYHSKDLVEIFGPELTNSANNIKKNIYDITNKKIFHKYTIAAIKNKISKNPIKKKIPDEKDILKEIIKYLR